MPGFNDFIQSELPLRPFTTADGLVGQIPVRSGNPLAARELVWIDPDALVAGVSTGSVVQLEAGENLVQGDPVRVTAGKLYKADNVNNFNVVGLVEASVTAGAQATAKTSGLVQLNALTPDSTYFLGGGSMTLNPPTSGRVIKMGRSLSSTSFLLGIGGSVLLS